jgi:hypothetical protein
MNRFSSPSVSGGQSKTFSFSLSFFSFQIYLYNFTISFNVMEYLLAILKLAVLISSLQLLVILFSCTSLICMQMRVRVLFLFLMCVVGGWMRGNFAFFLSYLNSCPAILYFISFKFMFFIFMGHLRSADEENSLGFMMMGLDSEHFQ